MEKVYLSKPGVVFASGNNCEDLWRVVTEGDTSGIKKVEIGGETLVCCAKIDESSLKKCDGRYNTHCSRIEKTALDQIDGLVRETVAKYGSDRVGVCVGSCDNGSEFSLTFHKMMKDGIERPEGFELEKINADYTSTYVKERFGITGPGLSFSTACSSSAVAIIKAGELIRAGIIDAAVAGGVDVANDTALLGFGSLEATSSEQVMPFSKNRAGINLGEAGAFFVLSKDNMFEETDGVYLAGWGETADAYHMTSPDPEGEGAFRSMSAALKVSGLKPTDIGYVNMHGTGTKFNDSMEGKAVAKLFGDYKVPCSSTKSLTGHTLGASAALEASICMLSILKNKGNDKPVLPVQYWDGVRDEEIPEINIVERGNNTGASELKFCMSNSFAFGGSNATIIIGKE